MITKRQQAKADALAHAIVGQTIYYTTAKQRMHTMRVHAVDGVIPAAETGALIVANVSYETGPNAGERVFRRLQANCIALA